MDDFLAASLSFPTVVFTVLLLVAVAYWLLVIFGAVGLDALDLDHDHAGGLDAGHGGHGDVDGHADAHADAHGHAGENVGVLSSVFWVLKLNAVPMTLVLSLVFLWSWLTCQLATQFLIGPDAHWASALGLGVVAVLFAFPLTSLCVRPLAPLFRTQSAPGWAALIGKVVEVDTGRVDATFGTARAEDGGAGLIVQIRCDSPNDLKRHDRALVLSFDEAREVYEVTRIDDFLPSDKSTSPD